MRLAGRRWPERVPADRGWQSHRQHRLPQPALRDPARVDKRHYGNPAD